MLNTYIILGVELCQIERSLEKLRAKLDGVRSVALDGMPRSGMRADFSSVLVKYIELEEFYAKKWDELIDLRLEIENVIESLPDPLQRAVLREKYIEGKSWEEVAAAMGYSVRQVYRIFKTAVAA